MKKESIKETTKEESMMLSARISKIRARKLRIYLAKADKKMTQWIDEKIDELPDEEESRKHHRKTG